MLSRDSSNVSVIVVWEHITPSDRHLGLPPTSVLTRIRDRRVAQYWDDDRAVAHAMFTSLPADTLTSVAEVESTKVVVIWDCVAVFAPGVRWDDRFPVPQWSARPLRAATDSLARRRATLPPAPAPDSAQAPRSH